MHKTLKFSVFLLSILVLITACSKDDGNGPSNPTPEPAPTGELTVKIGQETFTATSVTAREGTDGLFRINAFGSDGKKLQFVLSNFIGNATYPLGAGTGNTVFYTYLINGSQVEFTTDNGGGSLIITDYSSTEQKFDGTFTFEVMQSTGSSVLSFEDGELNDVPILNLAEAEPGKAKVYFAGNYLDIDSVFTRVNNNFSIEIFLYPQGYNSPIRIIGVSYVNNPQHVTTFGIPYSASSAQLSYFRPSQMLGEVSMTGDMNTVSGQIAMNDFDFQLNYNTIPITKNYMEVDPGELIIKYDGNTVAFNQADVRLDTQHAPETLTQTTVATNAAGDSLTFEWTYPGQFQPNYFSIDADETGIYGPLKYYSNGVLVKTEYGYFAGSSHLTGKSYGFDPQSADPNAMKMRGIAVPE